MSSCLVESVQCGDQAECAFSDVLGRGASAHNLSNPISLHAGHGVSEHPFF